jgi:hypothetical protein
MPGGRGRQVVPGLKGRTKNWKGLEKAGMANPVLIFRIAFPYVDFSKHCDE